MAKDKEDKTSQATLQYLIVQNRPFAINDLLQNAQLKDFGKSAVQKSIDQLVVAGKVKEKIYGKQKVYAVNQDLVCSPSDVNVGEIDLQIAELTRQISQDEEFLKKSQSELKILNSTLSVQEIKDQLKTILDENKSLSKKLEDLSQNKAEWSASDLKKEKAKREKTSTELRKRKRICVDILDQILENYPKPKKALFEEVGVVPD